jgi:hypothetical protein
MITIRVPVKPNAPASGAICDELCPGCVQQTVNSSFSNQLSGSVTLGLNVGVDLRMGNGVKPVFPSALVGSGVVKFSTPANAAPGTYNFWITKNFVNFKTVAVTYNSGGSLTSRLIGGVNTDVVDNISMPLDDLGITFTDPTTLGGTLGEMGWTGAIGSQPKTASATNTAGPRYGISGLTQGTVTGPDRWLWEVGTSNWVAGWTGGQNPVDTSNKELLISFSPPYFPCTQNSIG